MNPIETLAGLAQGFSAHGEAPAVLVAGTAQSTPWSYRTLAETVAALARGLRNDGLNDGEPVAIQAPNRPEWIAAYFATVSAGGIAVPIDDAAGPDDTRSILRDCGCRRLFTTAAHAETLRAEEQGEQLRLILLDRAEDSADEQSWRALLAQESPPLPTITADAVASLLYTSGTTRKPKAVPLTHGNFTSDLNGLLNAGLADARDRVILPLPLHHAYPFTVGMLTGLALGCPLIFPAGLSGPQITEAIRIGGATVMIGVPGLYTAMLSGIIGRATAGGSLRASLFRRLLSLSKAVNNRFGLRIGRVLFLPLHAALGPQLRLLGCGGAHLDLETWRGLEALGWRVLTGYGLTETAPVLSFNTPDACRIGTVGRPLPGVEIRIAAPEDEQTFGEVQARGPNVFQGYRDRPDETEAAFTADGWFRTGDLGQIDDAGFLNILGRAKEIIVLPDGKNVFPDALEKVYEEDPLIREAAIVEREGRLALLIVPEPEAVRARGTARLEQLFREAVQHRYPRLRPHERPSGFAVTADALPRTRLGKLRRHLLPAIYERALAGTDKAQIPELSEEDRTLLDTPPAGAMWSWLETRFEGQQIWLGASPQLDLGVDSLDWMRLTIEIEERFKIRLTESDLAEVTTLRDLLACAVAAKDRPEGSAAAVDSIPPEQAIWLEPRNRFYRLLGRAVYAINRTLARTYWRLKVAGRENLPLDGPLILAPNHASDLDPFVIAAALPLARAETTYWAGWSGRLFTDRLHRTLARAAQIFPIDPDRGPAAGIAAGLTVLERRQAVAWFPEGQRSPTGELLPFLPGVGLLAERSGAPVIPVLVQGAYEALPRHRTYPTPGHITVTFGIPRTPTEWAERGEGRDTATRIANALHDAVAELGAAERTAPQARKAAE